MPTVGQLLEQGWQFHEQQQWQQAERCYRQVLEALPRQPQALYLLGLLACDVGRNDVGIDYLRQAVEVVPTQLDWHAALATAYQALGKWADAAEVYQKVLAVNSNWAAGHNNLGNVWRQLGQGDAAIACYQRALEIDARFPDALNNLGVGHSEQREFEAAIALFNRAIEARPDYAAPYENLGNAYLHQSKLDEALAAYQRALERGNQSATLQYHLGVTLHKLRRVAESKECYGKAIEIEPDFVAAHNDLGAILQEEGQADRAAAHFHAALAVDPRFAQAYFNLGSLAHTAGRYREAESYFDQTLALEPEHASARFARALIWLTEEKFAAGWKDYEWRRRLPDAGRALPLETAWDGAPLEGRTILLAAEQGLGDTLQFIRYAPRVKARGGRVVVCTVRRLIPLLRSCVGIDAFCHVEEPLPTFDVHSPLASLPWLLGGELHNMPRSVPYLSAPAEPIERWREELAPDGRLRVGLNWQGNPGYFSDILRSIPLARFAPLAEVNNVRLVSLQQNHGVEQLATAGLPIEDLGSRLNEKEAAFCETAAIIQNLDLVITSDTAIAHLAGALGARVWLALAFAPDWRWLLERSDSPWYPTMRLFRQSRPGDWNEVFERIAGELAHLARAQPATS